MNRAMILYLLGWALSFEAGFLVFPAVTAVLYKETEGMAYICTALICLLIGVMLIAKKPKDTSFYAREGFVAVSFCWIAFSFTGALPFFISGEIPSFWDALFETVSGFTTTGASILSDVEALSHAALLWRSMTHWVGGMGVLVFILAILPLAGGQNIYLMRAESTGPAVNKFTSHTRDTALILYLIYFAMTLVQMFLLLLGGMPVFDAINVAMATAGTGGFAVKSSSLAGYSPYIQTVTAVFMVLFGVSFNIYFLALCRRFKQAFFNESLRFYLILVAVATGLVAFNIRGLYLAEPGAALRHAFFQVASIISTTGFVTADYNVWPAVSQTVLLLLMFIGSCAGSTAGGIKVDRILLMIKSFKKELHFLLHPRSVRVTKMDGKKIPHETSRAVSVFLIAYALIFWVSMLLLALDQYSAATNFTAVAATINNVGPGFYEIGPVGNFGGYSSFSKVVLIFDMLAGRLELFPLLLFFTPSTWKRQ